MNASHELPPRLLALSPGDLDLARIERFLGALRAAVGAGLGGLLLREPGLSDRAYLELGMRVRELGTELWLGVHDRLHLAHGLGAQGVHLGFQSLPLDTARAVFGGEHCLGLSTHAEDAPASWSAADYVFHGPVFRTPSKPTGSKGHREPIGMAGLRQAASASTAPVWALGGLGPEHVEACLEAGACGLGVLSGILGARDPAAATELYLNSFPS